MELGRIEGRYVGETQENLKRAFDTIAVNLPLIVLFDEIDQTIFSRRGEEPGDGNSIKADMRAATFKFLGDVGESGLAAVGMSNRPDLLDEASTDRFSIVPVLYANHVEGAQILDIQARRDGRELDVDAAADALQAVGEVFSGRQLVRLLQSAKASARRSGRTRLLGEDVEWALRDTRERVGPREERMALLAVAATSFNRHLPWNAARALGDPDAQPAKFLEPYVYADGSIDSIALEARIRELAHRGR